MNFLKLNSMELFLSKEVHDVTAWGLPSPSIFCMEKKNLSAWKKMNKYTSMDDYRNMPFMAKFMNCSWILFARNVLKSNWVVGFSSVEKMDKNPRMGSSTH
jgi:hypothetical protein